MTIVMLAGSPVSMKPWADRAKAIVWMSYSGMEGGTALAEVLFGAVNPSGKLAETLPEEIPECFRKEAYFPGKTSDKNTSNRMPVHIECTHLTQTYAYVFLCLIPERNTFSVRIEPHCRVKVLYRTWLKLSPVSLTFNKCFQIIIPKAEA